MKSVLIAFLALFLYASGPYVYICTGPQSQCYHKTSSCRGLNSCSKDIRKISLEDAKNMGRRPCRICYPE